MRSFKLAVSTVLILLVAACARGPEPTQAPYNRTWPEWNKVLASYVREGAVDYAGLAGNRESLDKALDSFAAVKPEDFEKWDEHDRMAFLINLHNAAAIKRVVDAWPVEEMDDTRALGSPLTARDIPALGRRWSLRDLQERILGEEFLEVRAVFLLNWAERGCAPLTPVAVTAMNLHDLLDSQSRKVLNDPRYAEYDQRERKITVTPLVDQYRDLFNRDYTSLWIFIQQNLPADQAAVFKARPPRIRFMAWDDSLNVAR